MSTGADIEAALTVIEENGGSGEYETAESYETPRWLFPRTPGAENIGYCEAKPKTHRGIHTKTTKCVDFTADPGGMYLSRAGIGNHDTDVETIASWLTAPRSVVGAVLLLGEPGTGKTALLEAAVTRTERPMTTVLCTPDHTKDSLFLRFVGEGQGDPLPGGGNSPFTLGPLPYAAKHGHVLYLDEFMLLVDGVKPLIYSLSDGRSVLPEGNVDGSPLEIHPDFRLVLSSNPQVRGASLPEPVASRCAGTTLTVETDGTMLRALGIDDSIISVWVALGQEGLWRPQIREMRVADYWLAMGDVTQAASALLPEHCPETQRRDVAATVKSHLGGDLRRDGRLVVS